jgi:hypothetical protein
LSANTSTVTEPWACTSLRRVIWRGFGFMEQRFSVGFKALPNCKSKRKEYF